MRELRIPNSMVRDAFAAALRMPADTGSNFFTDLRFCLRESLIRLLTELHIPIKNADQVGHRSRQIADIRDVSPLKHYSSMYKQEYVIDGDFCFGYSFNESSVGAINYVCGGMDRPSLYPFRTIRQFSIGNIAINTNEHLTDISVPSNSCFRIAGLALHNGSRKSPGPFIAFLGIHFDYEPLQQLLDDVVANLPTDYSALDEVSSCSTPVLWIARHTGKLFTCSCFDGIYVNTNNYCVIDRLCCLCTKRTPRAKCGHEMYYTPFQQTWNPYFPIFRARLMRDHAERYQKADDIAKLDRDAENLLRDCIGHPRIGEKWRKETELFKIVTALFAPLSVIHHYKGDELFGLEYDIYIPDMCLAIEYHGYQHFKSVPHWGGDEGLAKRIENDAKKKRLSTRHNVDLIIFTHKDGISVEEVSRRLSSHLGKMNGPKPSPAHDNSEADRIIKKDAERGMARRKKRNQTPTLWRPHLKPDQVELVMALLDWGCAKVMAMEGFSILGVMQRDDGNSMVKFSFETVKEAIANAQQQIMTDNKVRFYALALHCSLQEPDEEQPKDGFMVAIEREGLLSCLFVFFELVRTPDGNGLAVKDTRACYRTDQPLLRVNREFNANSLRQIGLGPLIDMKKE